MRSNDGSAYKNLRRALLLACAVPALSAPLAAQDAPAADQADDREAERVVVTAQRRSQRLQDVPISITALTGKSLEDAGVGRIDDMAASIPNVYVEQRDLRGLTVSVRGISADLNNPGLDQSVGVYVDGVYMGRATTINQNLYDLERVEVLRGPQGTLWGRNTIAGAMHFITRLPNDEFRAELSGGYGDYNAVRASGLVSGPLAENLFASVALSTDTREGFYKNTFTGNDLDDLNSQGGRVTLVYKPSENFDLVFHGDASKDRTNSGASDVLDNGAFTGAPFADADPFDRNVSQDRDTFSDRDIFGVSGEANWHADTGTLTAITAYRGYQWSNFADNDFTILDMLASGAFEEQTQFSQEVRWASDLDGPFQFVAGAFFFHQDLKNDSLATVGPDLGVYPTRTDVNFFSDVATDSYAAFVHATYEFNDQWELAGGLRYTSEDKEVDFSAIADPFELLAANVAPRTVDQSADNLSHLLTLTYKASRDLMFYGTYSTGFKAGGFNVYSITATEDATYDPETVDNYEIGMKSTFMDGRARFAASAFFMDYKDLQANQLLLVGGLPQFQTSNAAKAESKGIELELWMEPVDGLELLATYGYLDAEYASYEGATTAGDDFTGNTLPWAPKNNGRLAATYFRSIGDGLAIFMYGEATHRSQVFFEPNNVHSQDAVTLYGARLGLSSEDRNWEFIVWGRNLSDEEYSLATYDGVIVPGQVTHALGAPMTVGAEFRFKY